MDLFAPRFNAAGKVGDAGVALLPEKLRNTLAARASVTVHNDLSLAVDLGQPLGNLILGDQLAADLGDLLLPGFAHVEKENLLACVDAALQLFHGDLGNSVDQNLLLGGSCFVAGAMPQN